MLKEDIPFKSYDDAAKMARGLHFTIDRDGNWYCHDPAMGVGPIKNERIAALFAGAATGKFAGKGLSIDDQGRYWLKAPPNDVYGVDVEDVPFVIVSFREEAGTYSFTTNFGEDIALDNDHPLTLKNEIPYIEVRKGLLARIGRNVYYQLIAQAVEKDGQAGIMSRGGFYILGNVSE